MMDTTTEYLELTLLYVEDDTVTRNAMSEVFQTKVKNLLVAKNAKEALELSNSHNIHFVISDYQMPGMDGNELCRELKKVHQNISFVLLTAFNDSKLLIDAIDSGVDKFLQKPVDPVKLFAVMDEVYKTIENNFRLEKSIVCLQEAEKIALLSYWDVNLHTKFIHFSDEVKMLFGIEKTQDITYKDLSQFVKEKEKFLYIFENKLFREEKVDEILAIKNTQGKELYIHIIAKRWKSSACGTKHVIGMFQDVTQYEVSNRALILENRLDPMLKILNKKVIIDELQSLIKLAKRYGHPIGVMFFDIDKFKFINDNYGHLIADNILKDLASLITSNIRQSDVFGRWGGDEFVLVTGYSAPDAVLALRDKIYKKVESFSWDANIKMSISIGTAFYEAGDNVLELIERADKKMYEVKQERKLK